MLACLDREPILMDNIPEIKTFRLILRPVRPSDVEDIHRYASNPDVLRYTSWRTPHEFSETKEFVRRLVDKPKGAFALAICLKEDPRVIGIIEFGTREAKGGVDYSLAAEYWNQGIMTEAVRAVIDWGFDAHPELQQISSSAMPVNRGSTRVMEKCGMTFEKQAQDKFERSDVPVILDEYIIDRETWQHRRC
jgi:ribosomal-protein-alanine N-acetyltransferase